MQRPAHLQRTLVALALSTCAAGVMSTAAARGVLQTAQDDLLRRVAEAVGTRDLARGRLVLEGDADVLGTPCSFRLSFDGDGAFEQAVHGPLGTTVGSDGQQYWWIDWTGAPRRLSFEDEDKWHAIADLITDRWLDDPDAVSRVQDGDRIRVEFPDGMVEVIQFDPDTLLPSQTTFQVHSGPIAVATSDWRPVGPRRFPFCYRITEGGLTDTYTVRECSRPTGGQDPYRMPALERPKDHTFDAEAGAEIEVRPSPIHLLLVHPRLNGEDVGWFILDTGAEVMCIDPTVADELELPRIGRLPLTGVGGTITSAFRRAERFELGPLTLRQPLFCELDLTPLLPILKEQVAGIVGYDYLYRATVEIDVSTPAVRVFDPATYRLRDASWQEVRFSSGNPAVQARFEGEASGWFLLDTGDPSHATFFTGCVNERHMLEGRPTSAASSLGVGGAISSRAGEVAWLELGGRRFEHLGVLFSQATSGTFTTRGVAGSIGQKLLQPFRLVCDLGGARVAFVPRD